uniref:C2H2-type domain-containing protein n=1 Tax=Macrostomum lignano TaxID=282301 RepID=A0A1I8JBV9_9PLAT
PAGDTVGPVAGANATPAGDHVHGCGQGHGQREASYDADEESSSDMEDVHVLGGDPADNSTDSGDSESDDTAQEHDYGGPDRQQPVTDGSRHTYGSFCVAVQMFKTRHRLTRCALTDLLQLFESTLPPGSKIPTSPYLLRKALGVNKKVNCTHYCLSCLAEVPEQAPACPCCAAALTADLRGTYWQLDILSQVRQLIETQGLLRKVVFPADQSATEESLSRSTSSRYQYFKARIDVAAKQHVSGTVNIDSFQVFQTATYSICPVYLSINEVPERLKGKFLIICGFWCGRRKLNCTAFLRLLVQQLNILQSRGVEYSTGGGPDGLSAGRLFVTILVLLLDAPQRVEATCLQQFNALFGCDHCYIQTAPVPGGGGRFFPPDVTNVHLAEAERHGCQNVTRRTLEDTVHLAGNKAPAASNLLGVKSVSPLIGLVRQGFDYIVDSPFCYLHQTLGGVKYIICQLFSQMDRKPDKYAVNPDLRHDIPTVDVMTAQIRVPRGSIQRPPRSLRDLHHFRGHEFEAWLLAYGPLVLPHVLHGEYERYLQHFLLLSSSVFWLTLEGAPMTEVAGTRANLRQFGHQLHGLYSRRASTYNMHKVTHHMTDYAEMFGPIHLLSAAQFEAHHHALLSQLHGSRSLGAELHAVIQTEVACRELRGRVPLPPAVPDNRQEVDGVVVTHPLRRTDGCFRHALLPNGFRIEAYSPRLRARRTVSSFVGMFADNWSHPSDRSAHDFLFARVEAIMPRGPRVILRIGLLPVEPPPPQPIFSGAASQDNAPGGCSFRHVRRLRCDPFGELPEADMRELDARRILGATFPYMYSDCGVLPPPLQTQQTKTQRRPSQRATAQASAAAVAASTKPKKGRNVNSQPKVAVHVENPTPSQQPILCTFCGSWPPEFHCDRCPPVGQHTCDGCNTQFHNHPDRRSHQPVRLHEVINTEPAAPSVSEGAENSQPAALATVNEEAAGEADDAPTGPCHQCSLLEEQLGEARTTANRLDATIVELREQVAEAASAHHAEVASLRMEIDHLRNVLADRDADRHRLDSDLLALQRNVVEWVQSTRQHLQGDLAPRSALQRHHCLENRRDEAAATESTFLSQLYSTEAVSFSAATAAATVSAQPMAAAAAVHQQDLAAGGASGTMTPLLAGYNILVPALTAVVVRSALSDFKRDPDAHNRSRLIRKLLQALFTKEELQISSWSGKTRRPGAANSPEKMMQAPSAAKLDVLASFLLTEAGIADCNDEVRAVFKNMADNSRRGSRPKAARPAPGGGDTQAEKRPRHAESAITLQSRPANAANASNPEPAANRGSAPVVNDGSEPAATASA